MVGGEGGLISLYIYIEKFKNLLVRNQWTNFNIAWQECCFGDLLPKIVQAVMIRLKKILPWGGAYFSLYISIENFKIFLSETTGPISL